MTDQNTSSNEFAMGWKVLLAGVLGVACGASPIPFNVIGFTVEPLIEEFGWTRTQILFPITIFGIIASLLAPFFGSLADKYGVRKVALYSLLAFGLSFGAISFTPTAQVTSTLYIYYALWVLVGLIGIGSTPVSWSRAINLWFYKNRGLALGILLLGTSLAAIAVPKLAVWGIENYGWRSMFAIVAALPLFVALPIGYFLFREPRPEERPKAILSDSGNLTGVTLGTALKDYRFWLIWLSIAVIATAFGGAFINLPTMLGDRGLDQQTAATVMGVLGIGILSGRIITGALLDRFWQGIVAFPLLCLPAIFCYIMLGNTIEITVDIILIKEFVIIEGWLNFPEISQGFALAALAAFLLGFAAGAESDLIAYLTGRYFGMANYGKIYGMLYMPFGFFSAFSPIIYASVRDNMGSYDPILSVAIFGFVIGGGLLLFLGRYPDNFPETDPSPTSKLATEQS